MSSDKLRLLSFSNPAAFKRWLAAQPLNSQGAWLKFAKKGAAKATLNKSDAIDLALAHGWIDGQLGSVDELYFKTRFTPRMPKSAWSKINCERVKKLIESGQMTQQGLAQVDAAKADGRWEAAYPSQSTATPHADLQAALDGDPCARRVFDTLDSANRYAIISIGCIKRRPQKNEKRRSLNSWQCFGAAKRSILAAPHVAQVRECSGRGAREAVSRYSPVFEKRVRRAAFSKYLVFSG